MKCVKFLVVDQLVGVHFYVNVRSCRQFQHQNTNYFPILFCFAADEIKELWEEYENNSSIEANLVKDFDKVSNQLFS